MSYISPLTSLLGSPQEITYEPLSAIENVDLNIEENNQTSNFSAWEIAALHIESKQKLPEPLREVLIQLINPAISLNNRVEFPFTSKSNNLMVEIFWGNKRYLAYNDPSVSALSRLIEIPYDASEPEQYARSAE